MKLFRELKRRNVFRVALAYLVGCWLLLQILDVVGPILNLPDAFARYLLFLLVIGLIPTLIFAWVFELTPDGVKPEHEVDRSRSITPRTGKKLDRAIMVTLAIAVGLLLFDKLALQSGSPPTSESARTGTVEIPAEGAAPPASGRNKSVAVLPFVAMSNGPDDDYFADGLTEEIINSLAQLPDLLVTARTSAFHFKNRNIPIEEIAARLGVSHVVEGSVRRAGEQLRITAQLVRAADGFHLWSETYDRRTADTFAVQEDIAEKIAVALDILLDEARLKLMHSVGVRNIEAFTEYQKGREVFERAHGSANMISGLRQANLHFEKAVGLAPRFPDAYQSINDLYTHFLMSQGNGELDGNITDQDVQNAPGILRNNFDLAIRYAWNENQRASLQLDRELVLGNWGGLAQITDRALGQSDCNPAYWIHLVSAAFGRADALRETFGRAIPCDPFLVRPWTHSVRASLWLQDIPLAVETGRRAMKTLPVENHWVTRSLALALAQSGRADEARSMTLYRLRAENEKLIALFMIAASEGDAGATAELQQRYLATYGPNDFVSLTMEALRGNRNEANRLAGVIDSRPSGHLSLLQSVFWCTCGAPFEIEAAPRFSEMLSESGLPWPPDNPLNFPLKTW